MRNPRITAGKENGKIADGAWTARELSAPEETFWRLGPAKNTAKVTSSLFMKKCRDREEE